MKREFIHHDIALETTADGHLWDAMAGSLTPKIPTGSWFLLPVGRNRREVVQQLGVRCFGFSPLQLPPQLDFAGMFHGVDERVPVDGLAFGVRVLDRLLDDAAQRSKRPNGAYDATAEGSLPAAVGKQPEPGEFPGAVLSVVREDPPRGVARRAAWQVQHEVVILGHYFLLCARRGTVQVESDNFRVFCVVRTGPERRQGTLWRANRVAGITAGTGISWPRRVWY